jgi:hypothetical protein
LHDYLREFDAGVTNGIAVAELCDGLQREGFSPDMVIGHNGWGELLYVKDIWPRVPLLAYFEFYFDGGASLGRDDEVVTYSARNLEPYRGFHVFMRTLPNVLRAPKRACFDCRRRQRQLWAPALTGADLAPATYDGTRRRD